MLELPRNATMVLGLIVTVLIPAAVVATLSSSLAWYHGIGLFYGALGVAEIGYLVLLLVFQGSPGSASFRAASS